MTRSLEIIDVQIHEPAPWLQWGDLDSESHYRLTTELALASMDAVGVDAAVISTVDNGWVEYAVAHAPTRFAATPSGSPDAADAEEHVARCAAIPNVLGIRCGFTDDHGSVERIESGHYDRFFGALQAHQLAMLTYPLGESQVLAALARRFPEITLVIDHLGLPQPAPPVMAADSPPFKRLPAILELATYPNVLMKFSGAPTLSREPYPFDDLWGPLLQIVEAFGPQRLMWGTDIQRVVRRMNMRPPGYEQLDADAKRELTDRRREFADTAAQGYPGIHTYAEAVGFLRDTDRLSESDKEQIFAGTLRRALRWPKPA